MGMSSLRSSFDNSWKRLKIFLPFIWPHSLELKIYFILSFCILILSSVLNVYTTIFAKKIVDSLVSENNEEPEFRWDLVCVYFLFKYLKCIDDLKEIFWAKVDQNMNRELEISVFSHIQHLSIRWHLNRKTGEVLEIINKSKSCVSNMLNLSIIYMVPSAINTFFIVGYLIFLFDVWLNLVLCGCMLFYIVYVIREREKLTELRKEEINANYRLRQNCLDSLLNVESVKYFGNEKYEVSSFRKAVTALQEGELKTMKVQMLSRAGESLLVDFTLMIGTLMCVYKVVKTKGLSVGDYVMFTNYFLQIYNALDFFAYVHRTIKTYLIEIESLYELLMEKPEVFDIPDAKPLEITGGSIDFKNVFFEYLEHQPILKNVSFSILPGQTVAIVGPSGSGKSTMVRLIFRFYDVISGSILIDGQNVKNVTQESLGKSIGVVPQDAVLFNDTLRYNIQYGDLNADEEKIIEAAKGADLHKNILEFKNGYDTEVGERGLRLSGGEKQRVAIARTLLKAPQIILLDEATSALDTRTERNIQESLRRICSNRTTLMIAHRLSTIIHADQILVLKEGIIIERGRHEELLENNGLYSSMWRQQLTSVKNTQEESL